MSGWFPLHGFLCLVYVYVWFQFHYVGVGAGCTCMYIGLHRAVHVNTHLPAGREGEPAIDQALRESRFC